MNVAPFVIDIGSNFIKHEFSGTDQPNILRAEVGFEKYSRITGSSSSAVMTTSNPSSSSAPTSSSSSSTRRLIGKELDALRSVSRIVKPIEHGTILANSGNNNQNNNNNNNPLDLVQSLLRHCIIDCAKITPSEHPILLTEPVQTSDSQRQAIAQFLFEELRCTTLLFARQPVLSLHAMGRSTGVVLECGAGVTQTCAVFDGYAIREACARMDFGGNDICDEIKRSLRETMTPDAFANSGLASAVSGNGEWEMLQDMKHKLAQISSGSSSENEKSSALTNNISDLFRLPDGTELNVPHSATRNCVSDLLFSLRNSSTNTTSSASSASFPQQQQYHHHQKSLQEFFMADCLKKCDVSIRSNLLENIHLAGGTTLMTNFPERFANEVAQLVSSSGKVRVHAAKGRENAAWIGGSVLTQLSTTVPQFGVTRSQYFEEGEAALLKRKVIG